MNAIRAIFVRELALRLRGGGWAAAAGLFIVATGLAPLALGRDAELLAATGPGVMWLAAALALLIGLEAAYEDDLRSGALGVYMLSPVPLPLVVLIRMAAQWLTACLPLCVLAPIMLAAFGAPNVLAGALGFWVGTPALALLAGATGAVCAGLRRGTALVVFLSLPLFLPALVFGPASAMADPQVPLLVLGAFSLQMLAVAPFFAAAALRNQMA